MPKTYTSTGEARNSLLQQSKKWREEFKALKDKSKKAEDQALIKTIDGALDDVVSTTTHVLEKQEDLEVKVAKIGEGADVANKLAMENVEAVNELQKNVKEDDTYIKDLRKRADELERKAKSSLSIGHSIQLERSACGIICRNIRPVTASQFEKYEEMERAFTIAMTTVGYTPGVAYVRRLRRTKGDEKAGPAPLLVTLTTPGERAKLYNAIDRATRAGKQLGFSVTSEIPKYAIPTYKYMGRLATIIRAQFPELRTRVNIPRGEIWPTVSVKHVNDNKFVKANATMIDHAKSEYARANREKASKNQKKPASTQSASTSAGAGEPMDTGSSQSQAARPQRAVKKPKQ